jgi:hypothetical protein
LVESSRSKLAKLPHGMRGKEPCYCYTGTVLMMLVIPNEKCNYIVCLVAGPESATCGSSSIAERPDLVAQLGWHVPIIAVKMSPNSGQNVTK